jgi:hypothetical protein
VAVRAGARPGQLVAALGAITLILSLWLDWYGLKLIGLLRQAIEDEANRIGLGGLGGSLGRQFGNDFFASGWEAFTSTDVILFASGVLVLIGTGLTIGRSGGSPSPRTVGRFTAVVGAAAAGLVLVKILDPPGPDALVEIEHGAYVALAGATTMTIGGLLAARGDEAPR